VRRLRIDGRLLECFAAVPACHTIAGASLPLPAQRRRPAPATARAALASRNLALIIRTYRAATGMSQRRLAELLGYDPTHISMIETGRREIGLPAHTLGVSGPDDADFTGALVRRRHRRPGGGHDPMPIR
jgi:hypothetical protein